MAISHVSKLFGIADAKVYPVTADVSGGITYGTGIDVPGVKSLTIAGTVETKELRGDNQLLDSFSVLKSITATLNYAKTDFDILAAVLGATVADSGSGSTEVVTTTLAGDDALGYFKIEAKAVSVDLVGGDIHVVLPKCIAAGFPFAGLAEEDYQTLSLPCTVVPTIATGLKWVEIIQNETAAALSS